MRYHQKQEQIILPLYRDSRQSEIVSVGSLEAEKSIAQKGYVFLPTGVWAGPLQEEKTHARTKREAADSVEEYSRNLADRSFDLTSHLSFPQATASNAFFLTSSERSYGNINSIANGPMAPLGSLNRRHHLNEEMLHERFVDKTLRTPCPMNSMRIGENTRKDAPMHFTPAIDLSKDLGYGRAPERTSYVFSSFSRSRLPRETKTSNAPTQYNEKAVMFKSPMVSSFSDKYPAPMIDRTNINKRNIYGTEEWSNNFTENKNSKNMKRNISIDERNSVLDSILPHPLRFPVYPGHQIGIDTTLLVS